MQSALQNPSKLVLCIVLLGTVAWLYAGNLTPPPGPITSTMKTLVEVEPRTAVQSLSGADFASYVISEPGSYFLTGNITGEVGKHGIAITTHDVTLDLAGFVLHGVEGSLTGILAAETPEQSLITIKNGVVRGWGENGIGHGTIRSDNNWRITGIGSHENGETGILVQFGDAVIRECVATGNGDAGIVVYDGIIENSMARSNGENGIIATNAVIRECISRGNPIGINVARCTVVGCIVSANDVGIRADVSTVRECRVDSNREAGIEAVTGTYVLNNNCFGGDPGISVIGGANRVEGNVVYLNTTGIQTLFRNSIIFRNTATSNNTHYDITEGNTHGPIVQTRLQGQDRDLSTITNADHPWANFEH